jgi:hypothetical protein
LKKFAGFLKNVAGSLKGNTSITAQGCIADTHSLREITEKMAGLIQTLSRSMKAKGGAGHRDPGATAMASII